VVRGDVRIPADLREAVAGVDAVVHAATSPFRRVKATELEGTRTVLAAAESAGAHFIYPSIVGVDRVGGTYYRAKWQTEQIVESARHWTIQRATQLHPTLDRMLSHRLFPATRRRAAQDARRGLPSLSRPRPRAPDLAAMAAPCIAQDSPPCVIPHIGEEDQHLSR
jgi:uncharacterized protein YbjT (DUF2867 family)